MANTQFLHKKLLASAILTATLTACGGGGGGGDGGTPAPSGPSFDIANAQSIEENNDAALDIGTITASDADPGKKDYVFSVKPDTSTGFSITNNVLSFEGGSEYDFESTPNVDVVVIGTATITTTVAGTNGASSSTETSTQTLERTIRVAIKDINEAPTNITLSNATVAVNVDGATVGNLQAIDPDTNPGFQANTYTLSGDNANNFAIDGSSLKLAPGFSIDTDGATESVTVSAQGFSKTFTVTAELKPVGTLVPRTANNFYPVLPGLTFNARTGVPSSTGSENPQLPVSENPQLPVSETLQVTFGSLDSETNAYPLSLQIAVPVYENDSDELPSTTLTADADVEEHLVSTPASEAEALGVLSVKKYVVDIPQGIAKLGGRRNPELTITVEPNQAIDIFKQQLVTNTLNGQSVTIPTQKANVTLARGIFSQSRELDYSGYIYIEKQNGDDAKLPSDLDPEESSRTTYVIALNLDIDLSPLVDPLSGVIALPNSVSINSNMTVAEGLGFKSRSLRVTDTGNNLSITGAFIRTSVGSILQGSTSQGSADGDGDLWLNSVDQYPSDANFQ